MLEYFWSGERNTCDEQVEAAGASWGQRINKGRMSACGREVVRGSMGRSTLKGSAELSIEGAWARIKCRGRAGFASMTNISQSSPVSLTILTAISQLEGDEELF